MRVTILLAIFSIIMALICMRGKGGGRVTVAAIVSLIVTFVIAHMWVEVPPGTVGAVYNPFAGGIQEGDLRGGWHLIAPWANLQLWTVRSQEYTMSGQRDEGAVIGDDSMICQTTEGLQVKVDSTVIFHIDPGYAHRLWKTVGPNYVNTIVRPTAREAVRTVVSQFPIMSVYSNASAENMAQTGVTSYPGKRQEVEDKINAALAPKFEEKGIKLERVLLRNVDYVSQDYEQAIVNKQVAQQQVLTQGFLLQIEQIKAQQKTVQAEGQAEAIRLRGQALRANKGVVNYEFVRNLPKDLDITVMPGNGNILLNMPAQQGGGAQEEQPIPRQRGRSGR
jgi:hypothetical protein